MSLKNYIAKRKDAMAIENIEVIGIKLIQLTDSVGSKKFFPPSEYEKIKIIRYSQKIKTIVLDLMRDFERKYNFSIPIELVGKIESNDLKDLIECRDLGEAMSELGYFIKKESNVSFWMSAFVGGVFTVGEIILLIGFITLLVVINDVFG